MHQKPQIIGNVSVKKNVRPDGFVDLAIAVEGGEADVAIDTMLLAILYLCCGVGVQPDDAVKRVSSRMLELSTTLVMDSEGASA